MNTPVKKAGMAIVKSSQAISAKELIIMQPTITRTGEVAALGIAEMSGAKTVDSANPAATITEVKPVRPPAAIPAADST